MKHGSGVRFHNNFKRSHRHSHRVKANYTTRLTQCRPGGWRDNNFTRQSYLNMAGPCDCTNNMSSYSDHHLIRNEIEYVHGQLAIHYQEMSTLHEQQDTIGVKIRRCESAITRYKEQLAGALQAKEYAYGHHGI